MNLKTVLWKKSGLTPTRTGLGCLPLQRDQMDEAIALIRAAFDGGIRFFDTARAYTDSEEKVGNALCAVRGQVILATKTMAKDADAFWADLHTSLTLLRTDYIDLYQFHNPSFVPLPGGADGLYDAALEARAQGLIHHIGITQHSIDLSEEAIASGLYDTLQYPFNHLSSARDEALVRTCGEAGMGFIAMKALSGGLVTEADIPYAYLQQFEHVIPIWGMQRMSELEQILGFETDSPVLDAAMQVRIERDREALSGAFCRGCGYCQPCPVGIPIENANRMKQMLLRSPSKQWLSPKWQEDMEKITQCINCGACEKRCPYHLKPYETLPEHLRFYRQMLKDSRS